MAFDLNQLTVSTTASDHGLDNIPSDPTVVQNLVALSSVLEAMYNELGPFTIASAYRTPEVNSLVGGVETSLHITGQAADILPKALGLNGFPDVDGYFKKIVNSRFRWMLGEIINKAEQGALHVSLPARGKLGKLMTREAGFYRSLSAAEIAVYTGEAETDVTLERDDEVSSSDFNPATIAITAAFIASSIFVLWALRRRRVSYA